MTVCSRRRSDKPGGAPNVQYAFTLQSKALFSEPPISGEGRDENECFNKAVLASGSATSPTLEHDRVTQMELLDAALGQRTQTVMPPKEL